jgi:UrcA family protein
MMERAMTKGRIALLGSAVLGAALLCGAGAAGAQDYGPYRAPGYYDPPENVTVTPGYYDRVEKRQRLGRINGEINPTEYRISDVVTFSDLDLSQPLDREELRLRIRHTARALCFELNDRVPELRGSPSEDRECVRKATQEAMRDVYSYRRG